MSQKIFILAFVIASQIRVAPVTNVDFLVTSSDASPLLDIKAADVTIRIDGKTRTIQLLRLISVVEVPQADAPHVTNGLTSGRITRRPPAPSPSGRCRPAITACGRSSDSTAKKSRASRARCVRPAADRRTHYIVDFAGQLTNSPFTSFELSIDE